MCRDGFVTNRLVYNYCFLRVKSSTLVSICRISVAQEPNEFKNVSHQCRQSECVRIDTNTTLTNRKYIELAIPQSAHTVEMK
jgi:hypothetical protein